MTFANYFFILCIDYNCHMRMMNKNTMQNGHNKYEKYAYERPKMS